MSHPVLGASDVDKVKIIKLKIHIMSFYRLYSVFRRRSPSTFRVYR